MDRRIWAVVTLALLIGCGSAAAAADPVPIEVRLGARAGLDDGSLRLGQETAGALLAACGLEIEWRTCQSPGDCARNRGFVVLVHILPQWKLSDRNVTGEVVHDARTNAPIVFVYLNRNREVALKMRSSPAGRSYPALATLEVGHLVGLTIAHELGHALGLSHASRGVMKAIASAEDVMALRESLLTFSLSESARMRLTAGAGAATTDVSAAIDRAVVDRAKTRTVFERCNLARLEQFRSLTICDQRSQLLRRGITHQAMLTYLHNRDRSDPFGHERLWFERDVDYVQGESHLRL